MLIRPLFDKYQKYLLAFANTSFGRGFLELEKWAKIRNNYKIIKVAPDGIHWFTGEYTKKGEAICQAVFFPKSQYLKKFDLALTGLDICSKTINKIVNPELVIPHYAGLTTVNWLPLCMFSSKEFNPDAHVESTSVDGYCIRSIPTTGGTWDNIREGVGTGSDSDNATGNVIYVGMNSNDTLFADLVRCPFLFDIHTLGVGSEIESVIESIYGGEKYNNISLSPIANIYSCVLDSNTDIIASDYNYANWGITPYSDNITYADWNETGFNPFTYNAAGIAVVDAAKTGILCTGVRETAYDVPDSQPPHVETTNAVAMGCVFADNGSNKPKLVVTYIPGNSPFPTFRRS
jgi:hypothetical protein